VEQLKLVDKLLRNELQFDKDKSMSLEDFTNFVASKSEEFPQLKLYVKKVTKLFDVCKMKLYAN
jgi:hypothetical protein